MESKGPTPDPRLALRNLRIVFSAILMGVFALAAAAPIIRSSLTKGTQPGGPTALVLVIGSMILTIALSIAGYMLARSVSRPTSSTDAMLGTPRATTQNIVTKLTISAALSEAAAMCGILVYIMVGFLPVLAIAVLAAALGIATSFPRADLFGAVSEAPGDSVTLR